MFPPSTPHRAWRSSWRIAAPLLTLLAASCSGSATQEPGQEAAGNEGNTPAAPPIVPDAPGGETTPQTGVPAQANPTPTPQGTATTEVVPPPSPLPTAEDCVAADTSESVLRRLSRLEYQLSLKELFQLPSAPNVEAVPQDSDFKGFHTLAALQNVTTEHLRAYQSLGERLAEELLADEARSGAVIGCELEAQGCLESFVKEFGRLAYRRTLEVDEVAAAMALAQDVGGSAEEQFTAVVSALLSSANFLFRVEVGDKALTTELSTLSGEELASRLSFTLIGRGPSGELLDKGASGGLASPEALFDEAQKLLSDERAQEFYDAFFRQWLGFEQLRRPKQPETWWNDALMLSMQEETQRFLRDYAWGTGADFLDSFTANHSYMRADLAEFYGLPAPATNGYVEFPEDHDRAKSGLFTHAALLSAKRDGDRIAHRGAWIQSTFLCLDLQVPTALLDAVSDELAGLTFDQIFEKRNTDDACAGCHALIDPIGVGFAAYDEAGRFQADFDVSQFSVAPALPQANQPFSTAGELAKMLRERAEFAQCLTSKLFLYADGREPTTADSCAIAKATEQFVSDQHRFASLLEGLVTAPEFRLRRAPVAATSSEGDN